MKKKGDGDERQKIRLACKGYVDKEKVTDSKRKCSLFPDGIDCCVHYRIACLFMFGVFVCVASMSLCLYT